MYSKSKADELNYLQYHKLYPTDFIFIFILTICSVFGINAYQFGSGDQLLFLPLMHQSMDASIFPNDAWASQVVSFYHTHLWKLLGLLVTQIQLPAEHLIFGLYCILLIFTFSGLFRLSLLITNERGASYLALAMFAFSIELLPHQSTISSLLLGYHVALPFVLHGIWLWLAGRPVQGYALFGIASLAHPLLACYAVIFTLPLGFSPFYHRPTGEVILSIFALAFTAAPIWIWQLMHPAPGLDLWYYDPIWLEQVQISSGYIWNPSQWPLFFKFSVPAVLVVVLFCALAIPKSNVIRWFLVALVPVYIILFTIGFIFSNWIPFPLAIKLQLACSFPLALILSLPTIALFLRNQIFNQGLTFKSLLIIVVLTVLFAPDDNVKGVAFFIVIMLVFVYLRNTSSRSYYERTLPFILAIVLSFLAGLNFYFFPTFSLYQKGNLEWQSLQIWSKKNTPKDAIFIIDPALSGFRNLSERSVWFDWEEGKFGMGSVEFSHTWMNRLKTMGGKNRNQASAAFKTLKPADFRKISASEPNRNWYLVVDKNHGENMPAITESHHFKVARIR